MKPFIIMPFGQIDIGLQPLPGGSPASLNFSSSKNFGKPGGI
jgi:hypothetical protein